MSSIITLSSCLEQTYVSQPMAKREPVTMVLNVFFACVFVILSEKPKKVFKKNKHQLKVETYNT